MTTSFREVRLPADLCQAAEQRYGGQFPNIEDFLVFVLAELVRDDAHQLEQREQLLIEARLRDLGYL